MNGQGLAAFRDCRHLVSREVLPGRTADRIQSGHESDAAPRR